MLHALCFYIYGPTTSSVPPSLLPSPCPYASLSKGHSHFSIYHPNLRGGGIVCECLHVHVVHKCEWCVYETYGISYLSEGEGVPELAFACFPSLMFHSSRWCDERWGTASFHSCSLSPCSLSASFLVGAGIDIKGSVCALPSLSSVLMLLHVCVVISVMD